MSRIIFLGTAGNSAVTAKGIRAAGGIILQVEDLQLHIDPGTGALLKAREFGVNPHHTTGVLISQNHLTHCNDLNLVIDAMTHSGIEKRGVVLGSKSALQEFEDSTPYVTKYYAGLAEKIIPLEKNHKVGIDLVEINALPSKHTDEKAVGFKIFCPRFTLSYPGDTEVTEELLEALSGTDVLILNVTYPGDTAKPGHLDTQAAIKIVSHVRPKITILTHFGLEMLRADPLMQAREVQRITGIQAIAAKDGMAFSPEGIGPYKSPIKGY